MPDHKEVIEIGKRLRATRGRLGLTREALAFHSGVSWSAIAQIESGRRTNVRPDTLVALTRVLGVTLDYLVAGRTAGTMLDHRVLLYETEPEFFATATPFLEQGVERSDAVIAVTSKRCIARLRRQLGPVAKQIRFADRDRWYTTPDRALDGYRRFILQSLEGGAPWIRILGEPVWSGRSESDLRLWVRYESLLNLVFSSYPVTALCPYDSSELDTEVVKHACVTHPHIVKRDVLSPNRDYAEPGAFLLEA